MHKLAYQQQHNHFTANYPSVSTHDMTFNNANLIMLIIFVFTLMMTISNAAKKDIFILAGQSNMVGRAGVHYYCNGTGYWDGIDPPESSPDPSKIFRLNKNLTWEIAQDPLHRNIDPKQCGVGPGMTFANGIKQYTEAPIGLVPCAIGGTDITMWARGTTIYENMITRAKAATALGGEIKGFLWYQGESDTGNKTQVDNYRTNMENLINNVRSDLSLPSLPIIQVAIAGAGDQADPKLVEGIRNIQKSIELPNVTWVDAWGLECGDPPHYVHLTTASQVKLGLMLSHEYLCKFTTQIVSE